MGIYGDLFGGVVYPVWEGVLRRRPTLRYRDWLARTQWASHDELRAIQAGELRKLVEHVEQSVPHYRDILRERGLRAADFNTVDDIARFPLLAREDARLAGDRRKSVRPPFCDVKKGTGGSTGEPLLFGHDLGSERWRHATKLRGWGWAGYRPGDLTLFFWGPPISPPSLTTQAKIAADRLMRREIYFDCTTRSEQQLQIVADVIARRRPENLICYTNAGVDLARYIIEQRIPVPPMRVLCCAEALSPSGRRLLESAFGPQVFETYGCREVMLIGTQCEQHDGLHVSMENLIVEVLVREGGAVRPAEPGETGEVAITDLHNYGMPFIRYLNGDMAVAGSPERCACGRGLARLTSVQGRVVDVLRDAQGAPVCGILLSRIFSWSEGLTRGVTRWQCTQHLDDSVTLKLQTRGPLGDEALADVRRGFARYMSGVQLRIEIVDDIPVGKNGKLRPIIIEQAPPLVSERLAS
jgi:phenylacetate-coenzyme A ligase PaaK-like adenylate-forming protein